MSTKHRTVEVTSETVNLLVQLVKCELSNLVAASGLVELVTEQAATLLAQAVTNVTTKVSADLDVDRDHLVTLVLDGLTGR